MCPNNVAFFRNIAPCSPYVERRFGGTHLHLHGKKSAEQETRLQQVIFDPKDGCDMFLRNVGSHTDLTALYARRWQH
jgi:hypothetical protein